MFNVVVCSIIGGLSVIVPIWLGNIINWGDYENEKDNRKNEKCNNVDRNTGPNNAPTF